METNIKYRPKPSEGKSKGPIKLLIIKLLEFYRRLISPLKPPTCRYYPTCSEYAILSLKKHGLVPGLIKSVWRVLRCNPFSKGGFDPP